MLNWPPGRKKLDLLSRLEAVDVLTAVKDVFLLRELASILNIPEAVLSRYVLGSVIPTASKARAITDTLMKADFITKYLRRALERRGWDIDLLLNDPHFITLTAIYFRRELLKTIAGSKLDLIITFNDASALIASQVSTAIGVATYICPSPTNDKAVSPPMLKSRHAKSAAVIASYFSGEHAKIIETLLNDSEITVQAIAAVVLMDPMSLKVVGSPPVIKLLP
jgi:hypothetical protein